LEIGISAKGVEYHLSKLQSDKVLMRVGADKGGYWKILNDSI
jgi:predicted HTH transcriptional regulator